MNKKTVYAFANAINEHSIDKMCSLITDDHKFIDAHGNEVVGKDKMKIDLRVISGSFPTTKLKSQTSLPTVILLALLALRAVHLKDGNQAIMQVIGLLPGKS